MEPANSYSLPTAVNPTMSNQLLNNNEQVPKTENQDDVDVAIDDYVQKSTKNPTDSATTETQLTMHPSAPPSTQFVPTIHVPFEHITPNQSENVGPSEKQLVRPTRKKTVAHKKGLRISLQVLHQKGPISLTFLIAKLIPIHSIRNLALLILTILNAKEILSLN